jgi:putative selenium metabolism protein SsnA
VGPRADAPAIERAVAGGAGEVIDAGGGWIMPGFINAHTHFYSTFARGMAVPGEPPTNFMEILERLWWRLDKALTLEDVRYSALPALVSSLKAGVTTVIDHHASPNAVRGSLDVIAGAARAVGVRTCLCYEVSNRDGVRVAQEGLAENVAFLKKAAGGDGMVSGLFGLHASMTLDDTLLAQCVEAGGALGAGFHIHVAESRFDQDDSLARYGRRVARRLADAGALGPRTLWAHCIHIDDEERALLRDTRTNVVHNPQSNMNNAVGRADLAALLNMGIRVGLGTDGMSASMLDDARLVNLLHKHGTGDPRQGFAEAGTLLLENNRRVAESCCGRPLGVLAAGLLADVIVVDYDPPTPLASENLLGHVLFGLPSACVTLAMVNGEVHMRDGRVVGVDEGEIMSKSRERAAEVWARMV